MDAELNPGKTPRMTSTHSAFLGPKLLARGALRDVITAAKAHVDADEPVLFFEEGSGKQIELDLRGSLEVALEREAPDTAGRVGRPKLGVVPREVTLLPRHWGWLEEQPNGASAALRRIVEEAMKREPAKQRAQRTREAIGRVITAVAGDRPRFEDAMRALYQGDAGGVREHTARWPKDLRHYVDVRLDELEA